MSFELGSKTAFIPLSKPYLGREEEEAALQAIRSGQIGGDGPFGREVQRFMEAFFGLRHVLLTTSCTHALELAMMVLNIGPADEVIMPSFGFVTAATSVVRQGSRPVFVDIDETTFNIDPGRIEDHITDRTRAIMPVHYAGQGCKMEEILDIAARHGLHVVEDAAQGMGAKYSGRYLGTIGHIGCYSFHVTKNVTCGEGGAFLTNDDDIATRAEIVREKGTNRSGFLRGQVDKYTWVDIGGSFVLSDLLAAIILAQLKKLEEIHRKRRHVWEYYQKGLHDLEKAGNLILPHPDQQAEINWHIYPVRTDPRVRDKVIAELKKRQIGATFHFVPLHSSPYGQGCLGYRAGDLPVTERVAQSLIRLPIFPDLTREQQDYITAALFEIMREI